MIKRSVDFVAALLCLLLFAPVLLTISALILLKLGRPVLFKQERPGFHGRRFRMLKFRTMSDAIDRSGSNLPDEQRLSGFGRWLRSTSLDELPELWNVLRGDMSLVGPRPLLTSYLERYSTWQRRRHEVKPGITGWAQVNGRNALSWEEKFELDVWYVDNQSLLLDIKILAMTIWHVLGRKGISAAGHATMPEFMGTEARADKL